MALSRGPSPMALGGYAFRALGFGFVNQGLGQDTPWAEIDVTATWDSLQWCGPKGQSFAIKGVIFDEAFGGQASLDGIKGSAAAGKPLMLVTGAGRVHGLHVVFGVNEDRTRITGRGQARINSYEITLRRYRGGAGAIGGLIGAIGGLF